MLKITLDFLYTLELLYLTIIKHEIKNKVNYFPYTIIPAVINVSIWTNFVCSKFVKSNV